MIHPPFEEFLLHGKQLAKNRNVRWDIPLDAMGRAIDGLGWNLTALAEDSTAANQYLREFRLDNKALELLRIDGTAYYADTNTSMILSVAWQDYLKAVTSYYLFVRQNRPGNVFANIRAIKVIATCAMGREPWELTIDDINLAVSISIRIQPSRQMADLIVALVRLIIDPDHIAVAAPFASSIVGYSRKGRDYRSKLVKTKGEMLDKIEDRKRAERLPERRAFWSVTRIVLTEKPKTFADELRFAVIKVLLTCGLRIGEVILLPADWKIKYEYIDQKKTTVSMLKLRYFGEKQQSRLGDNSVLVERTQFVPAIFADVVKESLDHIRNITQPLRDTLKMQIESNRLFPWYGPDDIVPVIEAYTRLTGNPFWIDLEQSKRDEFAGRYKDGFSPRVLEEMQIYQQNALRSGNKKRLDGALYVFLNRLRDKMCKGEISLGLCRCDGTSLLPSSRNLPWGEVYFRVSELENYIRMHTPTKISDMLPIRLEDGKIIQPWEMLFLNPKRPLSEARNGGVCDVTRIFSVGVQEQSDVINALGVEKHESLFSRYCTKEEDKKLKITSHAFRHLQNTELFRLGVADSIITTRYGRKSVAQSYEYDHRSLAEKLDAIELPGTAQLMLSGDAEILAKMIIADKARGPLVNAFKKIQVDQGDDAAFAYLSVEADGFHATPYGFCVSSFLADPCPNNLECFAGCKYLTAVNIGDNVEHLKKLKERIETALVTALARPANSVGRENQIKHAEIRLKGIQAILDTPEGEQVFLGGPDKSKQRKTGSVIQ